MILALSILNIRNQNNGENAKEKAAIALNFSTEE